MHEGSHEVVHSDHKSVQKSDQVDAKLKGVTAKMSLSLSISGHTLVMESPKLGPGVKAFKEENDSNNLTLWSSLGDAITKVWPEIQRLIDIFAVTPFS